MTRETLAPDASWRVRLAFAFGQIPEGVQSSAFGFFLLFFYNQVLGVSGFLASTAIVIALVVDAVVDPIVGSASDRSQSRWGRRHPYMYGAAVPFALCFYLLFAPPAGLSELELFGWLLAFSILTRITQSFYSIPHTALTAELATGYDERTTLSALRSLFGSVGTLLVFLLGLQGYFRVTELNPSGQLNPAAYPEFGAAFAIIICVGVWITALGTHDQIPKLPRARPSEHRFRLLDVLKEAGQAFALRPFKVIVTTSVLWGMTMGMVTALSLYLGTLYFQFTIVQISWSFPASVVGGFIGAALASPLGRIFPEKRTLLMAGLAWYAVWNTSPIILSLLGFFPEPGDVRGFYMVLTANAICSLGIGVLGVMIGSMVSDITDQHEEVHGSRNEGIYFAALSFAAKAVGGFGIVISGIVVDLAGITRGATAATVNPDSLAFLGIAMGPGVLVMIALTVYVSSFYGITRAEHGRIRTAITARTVRG
ncbi:MAG: MFS transporter [Gammaproteobacteria bacterium]|nr:MFS transporter [Gammaproteobacteria bacterium]